VVTLVQKPFFLRPSHPRRGAVQDDTGDVGEDGDEDEEEEGGSGSEGVDARRLSVFIGTVPWW